MVNTFDKDEVSMTGRTIRRMREELGLTQEQFARLLGVTVVTVNRWENGHFKPSPLARAQVDAQFRRFQKRRKHA